MEVVGLSESLNLELWTELVQPNQKTWLRKKLAAVIKEVDEQARERFELALDEVEQLSHKPLSTIEVGIRKNFTRYMDKARAERGKRIALLPLVDTLYQTRQKCGIPEVMDVRKILELDVMKNRIHEWDVRGETTRMFKMYWPENTVEDKYRGWTWNSKKTWNDHLSGGNELWANLACAAHDMFPRRWIEEWKKESVREARIQTHHNVEFENMHNFLTRWEKLGLTRLLEKSVKADKERPRAVLRCL
jgi:hypothetical protein